MILVDKKQENLLHHWFDLIKMTRGNSTLNPALNQLMNLNPTKSLNPLKKKNSWSFFQRRNADSAPVNINTNYSNIVYVTTCVWEQTGEGDVQNVTNVKRLANTLFFKTNN